MKSCSSPLSTFFFLKKKYLPIIGCLLILTICTTPKGYGNVNEHYDDNPSLAAGPTLVVMDSLGNVIDIKEGLSISKLTSVSVDVISSDGRVYKILHASVLLVKGTSAYIRMTFRQKVKFSKYWQLNSIPGNKIVIDVTKIGVVDSSGKTIPVSIKLPITVINLI